MYLREYINNRFIINRYLCIQLHSLLIEFRVRVRVLTLELELETHFFFLKNVIFVISIQNLVYRDQKTIEMVILKFLTLELTLELETHQK